MASRGIVYSVRVVYSACYPSTLLYYLLDGPLAAVILDEEEVGQKQVRRAHGEERGEAEGFSVRVSVGVRVGALGVGTMARFT